MLVSDVEKMKADKNVEELVKTLMDENWQVRMYAAGALGGLRDARAVEPLTKALDAENDRVREAAREALMKIREKES
jgi:HEAT repeat protein